jgi:hypothetical protein
MKTVFIIVCIAALIGMLVVLNNGISNVAPPHFSERDAMYKAQAEAAAKAAKEHPVIAATTVSSTQIFQLPAEQSFSPTPNPKYKITVGWVYDGANQPHPEMVSQVISAVKQVADNSHGQISVEVVNLDVSKADLSPAAANVTSLGVEVNGSSTFTVNGRTIDLSDNPGEGATTVANTLAALKSIGIS